MTTTNAPTGERDAPDDVQARLEAPGAGIPWFERKWFGAGLRLFALGASREKAWAKFEDEADRLLSLAGNVDEETGRRRVLVPRQSGMEDSSRFWSPYMIVQHVTIVDRGLLMLVRALAAGKSPDREISTAAMKPSADAGPESLEAFRETVAARKNQLAANEDLKTGARKVHPWFGSLDAHQWFCLAGIHHGIHRKQMEQVLKGARTP